MTERRLTILYGSQTDNSKSLAELLTIQAYQLFGASTWHHPVSCKSSTSNQLVVRLNCMNEYTPISNLAHENGIFIFVCSTTGYGVAPDNMLRFWQRLMHRSLIPGRSISSSMKFAVLGLGDSSYSKYNFVAKKLYRRLVQLGASPLELDVGQLPSDVLLDCIPNCDRALGLANEQDDLGVYQTLAWWIPLVWKAIAVNYDMLFTCFSTEHGDVGLRDFSWMDLNYLLNPKGSIIQPGVFNKFQITCHQNDCSIRSIEFDEERWTTTHVSGCCIAAFQVLDNKRVTHLDHFQDTRLLKIGAMGQLASNSIAAIHPGDVFYVQPQNHPKHVHDFFALLSHLNRNQRVKIVQSDANFPLPVILKHFLNNSNEASQSTNPTCDISLIWLVTYYFDLNRIPNQLFFIQLSALAHSLLHSIGADDLTNSDRLQMEAERLLDLGLTTRADMMDDLLDYIYRPSRRVIEVLYDFPITSSYLKLENLFNIMPGPIQSKPYSIAQSSPESFELLVSVVSYQTQMQLERFGIASRYLASLQPTDSLVGWIESQYSGRFQFYYDIASSGTTKCGLRPCIFVCAGTGIAPVRCFIQRQVKSMSNGKVESYSVCRRQPYLVVFGCRYATKDFYFGDEWNWLQAEGWIHLISAFSREGTQSGRIYVQHQLRNYATCVWNWLKLSNCCVYIVGNEKTMPDEVCDSLRHVVIEAGNQSEQQADDFMDRLKMENRLQIECWN